MLFLERGAARIFSAVIFILAVTSGSTHASSHTWFRNAAGTFNWTDTSGTPTNWIIPSFPNAAGDFANLNNNLLGDETINLNQDITVGVMTIGDSDNTSKFTIASGIGTNTLIFDNGANAAELNGTNGSKGDTISVDIGVARSLIIAPNSSSNALTLSGAIKDVSVAASVSFAGFASTMAVLGGANLYSGTTTINNGQVTLNGSLASKTVTVFGPGLLIVNGSLATDTTLTLNGGSASFTTAQSLAALGGTNGSLNINATTLTLGAASDTTSTSGIGGSNAGMLIKQGAGLQSLGTISLIGLTLNAGTLKVTLDVGGPNLGGLTFNGGTFQAGSANALFASRSVVLNDAGGTIDTNGFGLSLSAGLSGTGGLTKTGPGSLTLSGSTKTYGGATTINAGTLSISSTNTLPVTTAVTVATGATLSGGSNINFAIGSLAGAGTVDLSSATITVGGDNTSTTFSGNFTGSGVRQLAKTGSGILTLSGASLNVGLAINSGTVAIGSAVGSVSLGGGTLEVTNSFATSASYSLSSAGIFQVDAGQTFEIDSTLGTVRPSALTKTGTGTLILSNSPSYAAVELTAGTLQTKASPFIGNIHATGALVFDQTTYSSYANTISGSGTLTKSNSGTVDISSAQTYTGSTFVTGGKLLVDSTLASPAVSVSSGATLGGHGTLAGSVIVASGGNLSPGNSPGILSTGSVTLATGSFFNVELNGATAGPGYDQLEVTGTVGLAGDVFGQNGGKLSLAVGFSPTLLEQFYIVANDGLDPINGTFDGLPEGATLAATSSTDGGLYTFKVSYLGDAENNLPLGGNDVVLTVIAVPEPAAGSSLALGALSLFLLRNRWARVFRPLAV